MLRFFDILTYLGTFIVIFLVIVAFSSHPANKIEKFQKECAEEQGEFSIQFNVLICNHNK